MNRYKVIIGKQVTYNILANNEVTAEELAWKLYQSSPISSLKAQVIEVKQRKEKHCYPKHI